MLIFFQLWSLPSLLNGFPLIYYDSAFYINLSLPNHPFKPQIMWRPETYSYLISPFLNHFGFLSVILVQNLMAAIIVIRFIRINIPSLKLIPMLLILTGLLITSLIYCSNFIMPDFLAGLSILTVFMYLSIKTPERYLWLVLSLIFAMTHYSHPFILLPIFLIEASPRKRKSLITIFLTAAVILSFHITFMKPKTNFEKAAHYFIFSRFVTHKRVLPYLQKHCDKDHHLSNFPPCREKLKYGRFHIWNERSTINNMGGYQKALPEIVQLNQALIKSPQMLFLLKDSLFDFFKQIFLFAKTIEITENDPVFKNQLIYHSKNSLYSYENARLFNSKKINLKLFQEIQKGILFLLISLSFLIITILNYRKQLPANLKRAFYHLNLGYISNSLFCSFFTDPMARYNSRLVWIYFLLLLLWICIFLTKLPKNNQKQSQYKQIGSNTAKRVIFSK